MDDKYEKLKEAIRKAINAANLAQTEDGGTCNFDSPVLCYKEMGYSRAKALAAVRETGLDAWPSSGIWKGCIVMDGMTRGQGNCRTAMAEAFAASLNSSGIKSGVYYQMN